MPRRLTIGYKCTTLLAAILGTGLLPHPARAALGEPESSVTADVQQLKASIKSTTQTNYRVHEIQLPSGTVVREFSGPDGKIFAVTWKGPAMPNLRQTLGTYFGAYTAAAQAPHAGRGLLQVRQPNLVIQSSGHMRAFAGRAYLPQAVPSGVSVEELH